MTDPLRVSPPKYYEVNLQVCKVLTFADVVVVGANRTLITAVAGRIIRVMGLALAPSVTNFALGATPSLQVKNGSGGASLLLLAIPNGLNGSSLLPITDSGYCETSSGVGLFTDVNGTNAFVTVFYITYAP